MCEVRVLMEMRLKHSTAGSCSNQTTGLQKQRNKEGRGKRGKGRVLMLVLAVRMPALS